MAQTINDTYEFAETVSQTAHTQATVLPAGTKRKIVVQFHQDAGHTVTGATFNGAAMSEAISLVTNAGDPSIKSGGFYYDVSDALAASTYDTVLTTNVVSTEISFYTWVLVQAATGALEVATSATANNATVTVGPASGTATTGAVLMASVITGSATPTWTMSGDVTEGTELTETNYTTCPAQASGVASGSRSATGTASSSAGYKNLLLFSSAAYVDPTYTVTETTTITNVSGVVTGTGTTPYVCGTGEAFRLKMTHSSGIIAYAHVRGV